MRPGWRGFQGRGSRSHRAGWHSLEQLIGQALACPVLLPLLANQGIALRAVWVQSWFEVSGGRDDPVSPLASPAIGTSNTDLIERCADEGPPLARIPPVDVDPPLAVAFSGGGFRATLAALGVARFLADAGLLGRVRYLSSVSGGSVANGLLAAAWDELAADGFGVAALDRLAVRRVVERITSKSLTGNLARNLWRTIGRKTRTDLLADAFDDWFFHGRLLEDLSEGARFVFNAANVTTGVRFGFERDAVGDWVLGRARTAGTGLRLAQAVAASAAVPGLLAPFAVRGMDFPCARGRVPLLVDGGAYDNLGLEVLDDLRDVCLVGLNAGGVFQTGPYGGVPIIRNLQRASALLYRQTTALRLRTMVERFQAWERADAAGVPKPPWARRGVVFGLATTPDATDEWLAGRPEHDEWRRDLALTKTSFARFEPELCRRLVYRGWWLAGAVLSRYHRGLLPDQLPSWTDPR